MIRSQEKKRSKSEKKQDKEERRAAKKLAKATAKAAEKASAATAKGSSLRQGKYQGGAATKASMPQKAYDNTFKRQIVETSIILDAEGDKAAKMQQFTMSVKTLPSNLILLDETAQIDPRDRTSEWELYQHQDDIPHNHSKMSFHIRTSGGGEAFNMQKPRKNEKKKGQRRNNSNADSDEEEGNLKDPQVDFNFAMSSDLGCDELLDRISCEWAKVGGQKFYPKDFESFDTETAVMALKTWNRVHGSTFVAEFC